MDWCWNWNSNTLATWCEELTHWKRPWYWAGLKAGGEGDNRGWEVGWHHRFNGHEFEQATGVADGQGSPACCSPWGCKEVDMTEQLNWRIQMTVSYTFLRCFADTVIATRGKNLTAWWPDCSHDINCCIFFFKYSWFIAFTIFCQSLLYSKVTQLYTYKFFPLWFITGYWI